MVHSFKPSIDSVRVSVGVSVSETVTDDVGVPLRLPRDTIPYMSFGPRDALLKVQVCRCRCSSRDSSRLRGC